uniref:Retrotransposon gag domain-containing protein n=1 Tax=Nelumbo nucifera TaxID=4432 RepID=A0A822Y4G4_NELNU|nr:TPA_asm: hypothetical protein HUJ06_028898 [Nelumbo nucifera]
MESFRRRERAWISQLETIVETLVSAQERMMKEMQDMLAALTQRMEQSAVRSSGSTMGTSTSWLINLDFPRFDGNEDPASWIYRVEQFFEIQKIKENEKLPLAAYHLEGDVQLWYHLLKQEKGVLSWEILMEELRARYGPSQYDDPFGELTKLRQTGTVREYQSQFERLLSRTEKLSQAQQISCFISGLKDSIRVEVQARRPSCLLSAVGLACLYEAHRHAGRHEENGEEPEEKREYEVPAISVHAMTGCPASQTMRIKAHLGGDCP